MGMCMFQPRVIREAGIDITDKICLVHYCGLGALTILDT